MTEVEKWKWFGGLLVFCGIIAIITERSGWTIYGRAEGTTAQVVGVIMILIGIKLIFPMLLSRKKKTKQTDEKKYSNHPPSDVRQAGGE